MPLSGQFQIRMPLGRPKAELGIHLGPQDLFAKKL